MRRGLLLYGFGLIFYEIWAGSILPYYGGDVHRRRLPVHAPVGRPRRDRRGLGASSAPGIQWWTIERTWDGHSTTWLHNPPTSSPRGLLFDLFVNGTHPLFPWLAFLCAGMILGRVLRTDVVEAGVPRRRGDAVRARDAAVRFAHGGRPHPADAGLWPATTRSTAALHYTASALGTARWRFTVVYTAGDVVPDLTAVQCSAPPAR